MSKKVLIIEDDQDTVEGMSFEFEKRNFSVKSTGKLSLARSMLVNEKFDLVILDYQLSGDITSDHLIIEFEDSVTNSNPNKKTPIIVCSGTLDPGAVKKFSHVTKHFLVKPISFSDIEDKLIRLGLI